MLVHPFARHATLLALLALAVTAPTIVFVTASMLAYGIGLSAVATWIEPFMAWLQGTPRIVDLFLLTAPFLAFVVALVPCLGTRPWNLVVIGLCVVVGGFLAAHVLAEFLLEAP